VFATTSDGVRLALHRFPAAGSGRGVVLLTHAMMANASYLRPTAQALAAAGLECFTLDFRGHGASGRTRSWGFDAYVEQDLPAAVAAVTEATGVAPDHLGHSLGGLVAAAAFARGTVSPSTRLALIAASPWTRNGLARRALIEMLTAAARPLRRLPVRALRLGTDDEPLLYLQDFRSWVRARAWPWVSSLSHLHVRTLAVVGDRDLLCTVDDARVLGDPLRCDLVRMPGVGHFGFFRALPFHGRLSAFFGIEGA
jgi:alpha-beta hydrolase superfamily lysophospholipase